MPAGGCNLKSAASPFLPLNMGHVSCRGFGSCPCCRTVFRGLAPAFKKFYDFTEVFSWEECNAAYPLGFCMVLVGHYQGVKAVTPRRQSQRQHSAYRPERSFEGKFADKKDPPNFGREGYLLSSNEIAHCNGKVIEGAFFF